MYAAVASLSGIELPTGLTLAKSCLCGWDWLKTTIRETFASLQGSDAMRGQQINRISTIGLIVLSLTALLTVLLGLALPAVLSGHIPPPEPDEGTGAHIFQLSIAALVPVGFLSLATADWTQPLRSVRRLAFPAAAVVLAFSILFYFEHYYFPAHGSPLPRPGLPLRLLRQLLGAVRLAGWVGDGA